MLLTTTNKIEGKTIADYKGLVTAEAIVGAHIGRDLLANLRDFFGGRSRSYEKVLSNAKEQALQELEEKAKQLGANAVIGIDFEFGTVGQTGSMLMVIAFGTAVVLE